MAVEKMDLPPATRRRLTLNALNELAEGRLAERLRLEEAARLLCTARRALELTGGAVPPLPALQGWDRAATTAREHVETLTPQQIDQLLAEGPDWAAELLRRQPALRLAA
ncbi:hypothetical protein [Pseudoroseomonas cervicalis]|uniref:hypothetical protein n=1 Tax=Teichococcus cervicalis TaxID=204525 RepID=UPI00278523DB|nr:hypothetical protein [Pseudoroseomonas cervicalis]MDQ1080660.1 hypothetical protein [Pseudoroseomonas cervicalis]